MFLTHILGFQDVIGFRNLFFTLYVDFLAEGNGNYKIEEGQCNVGTMMRIPRADVAHFMLTALETDEYDRKALAIASV